jgi:hypothetical protein
MSKNRKTFTTEDAERHRGIERNAYIPTCTIFGGSRFYGMEMRAPRASQPIETAGRRARWNAACNERATNCI